MILLQWKYSKISTKQKKKRNQFIISILNERLEVLVTPNCLLGSINKLKKVRRLCENCYQFKELNPTDRVKLMEVSMYELILVS